MSATPQSGASTIRIPLARFDCKTRSVQEHRRSADDMKRAETLRQGYSVTEGAGEERRRAVTDFLDDVPHLRPPSTISIRLRYSRQKCSPPHSDPKTVIIPRVPKNLRIDLLMKLSRCVPSLLHGSGLGRLIGGADDSKTVSDDALWPEKDIRVIPRRDIIAKNAEADAYISSRRRCRPHLARPDLKTHIPHRRRSVAVKRLAIPSQPFKKPNNPK